MANPEASQQPNVESKEVDYKEQLDDITKKINQITNAISSGTLDDNKTEINGQELSQKFDDSFKDYIKSDPEGMNLLANALGKLIEKGAEKFEKDNTGLYEDLKPLIEFAKSVGIELQNVEGKTDNAVDIKPEFPKFGLEGKLKGIEAPKGDGSDANKFWSNLSKDKPAEGSQLNDNENLYKTINDIDGYLDTITKLLGDEKLKNNEGLLSAQTVLNDIKNVIENTTEDNVRNLQDFISNNLKGEDYDRFRDLSFRKNNNEFDGKFGVGTLTGLNIVLKKVGDYVSDMEKTLNQLQQQEQTAEPDKQKPDQGSNQQTTDKPEASVDKPPQAVEPLKLGDGEHKPILINGGLEGATFYSINVGNEKMFRELENGDLECYMKIGDNLYEARFDQSGYLCPVATLIDDINGSRRNVLIGKNLSCIGYLNNKIPEEIKQYCRIGWAGNTQDYTLESTNCGKRLTIEPMTIAGHGLISKNLPRSLGFLHLANCLRSGVVSGGLKDADVNRKLKVKNVRDSEGNKISIKKENYGLAGATSDELAAFKRYNNPETWKNHASINGNKNNQYRKIGLPFEPKLDFNSAKYIETSGIVPESSDDSGSITKTIETGDGKLNVSVENVVKSNTGEGKSAEKIRSVSDIKAELGDIDYNNLNFEDFQDGVEVNGIQKLGIRMDGFGFREFNGNVIIGKWVDGGISEGVVLRKNGDKYIGGLAGGDNYTVNGEPAVIRHGNGEMKYADGAEYNGEFKNGAIFTGVFEHEGIKLDLHDGKLVGENGEKLTQVVNGNGVEYRLKQLCEWLKDVKSVDGNFLGQSIVLNKIDGTRHGIHFEDRSFGDERILAGWMNDYIEKHKNES